MPAGVERAVAKALAKSPADRFGSAAEFARALAEGQTGSQTAEPPRTAPAASPCRPRPDHRATGSPAAPPVSRSPPALAIGFVLGLGVLFGWLRSHGARRRAPAGAKRLAVLPFENLGAAEDEYFADGVTDEVRGKLAVACRAPGDRAEQLGAVQEDQQDAAGDRRGSWGWTICSPAPCDGRREPPATGCGSAPS